MATASRSAATKPLGSGSNKENLRVPKLGHVVADRIRQRIASGEISAGDRLPSESDMLVETGVSRPTLREALRVLESEGIISVGRGMRTGAAVVGPSIGRVAQYANLVLVSNKATLAHIQEVRMLLEPSIAATLAQRASRKTAVEALRRCLENEAQAIDAGLFEDAVRANNEFHELLVSAANNPVLLLLIGMLHDMSATAYTAVIAGENRSDNDALKRNIGKSLRANVHLTDLIAKGSSSEAETYWRKFMERTLVFLEHSGIGARRIRYASIAGG